MKLMIINIEKVLLVIFLLNLLFLAEATPINRENKNDDVVFLKNNDFNASKEDINYNFVTKKTDIEMKEEIRARIIALVWVKTFLS